jgi:hypothetical protein
MSSFNSWLPLFVILAFILSEKAALPNTTKVKTIIFTIISVLLFFFCFGAYPPMLNTIAVVFLGKIIIDIFLDWDCSFSSLKSIFFKYRYCILSFVIAGGLIGLVLKFLGATGKLRVGVYTMKTIGISDIPTHFANLTSHAFTLLWNYPIAFFPPALIRLFAIVLLFAAFIIVLNICSKQNAQLSSSKKIIKIGTFIFFLFCIIVFSKTVALISPEHDAKYDPRILFYGDSFLHIFPIALIFIQSFKFPKTIVSLICIVLINMCFIQDALALKVWKFGFEAEKMMWNRVMARIESAPEFNPKTIKDVIFIGNFPSYRPFYYSKSKEVIGTNALLHRGYSTLEQVSVFGFFFPDSIAWLDWHYPNYLFWNLLKKGDEKVLALTKRLEKEINSAQAYPAKNSIIVKDDVLVIVLEQGRLNQTQNLLKENNEKKV